MKTWSGVILAAAARAGHSSCSSDQPSPISAIGPRFADYTWPPHPPIPAPACTAPAASTRLKWPFGIVNKDLLASVLIHNVVKNPFELSFASGKGVQQKRIELAGRTFHDLTDGLRVGKRRLMVALPTQRIINVSHGRDAGRFRNIFPLQVVRI